MSGRENRATRHLRQPFVAPSRSSPSMPAARTISGREFIRSLVPAQVAALVVWSLSGTPAWSQDDRRERIIDQAPHDVLVLKGEAAQQFKIEPLEMTRRRPIATKDPEDTVIIRLLDGRDRRYQVKWSNIERIELFEQLVLAEAAQRVAAEEFDAGYEYYRFLDRRDPEFPGLPEAWQRAMIQEATYWLARGEFEQALALLNEIHGRNPRHAELHGAYGSTINELVTRQIVAGNYGAARELLEQLESRFTGHDVVRARQEEIIDKARGAIAAARAAVEAGDMAAAHEHAANAMLWWPALDEARRLQLEIRKAYPILEVGVQHLAGAPKNLDDWAERRCDRLLRRRLLEPADRAHARTVFASPFGSWKADGTERTFQLAGGIEYGDGRPVTVADIAQAIGAAARRQPSHVPRVATAVETLDASTVRVLLSGPFPWFDATLDVELAPWNLDRPGAGARIGPYVVAEQDRTQVRFEARPDYFAATATQPRMLIERRVTSPATAINAMKQGRLVAVDRIMPWDLDKFTRAEGVVVKAYANPAVHVLVYRTDRDIGRRAEVRRAIAHGINRVSILRGSLMVSQAHGALIDGVVPARLPSTGDTSEVYEPRLMLAGLNAAGYSLPAVRPRWVLAHGPSEIARRASAEIARQLALAGQGPEVVLAEWDPATPPESVDWDLMYVELASGEPALALPRLVERFGLAPVLGPSLGESLVELLSTGDPDSMAARFERIDALIREQRPFLALWSLNEHLAHVPGLEGIPERPVTLYENIEQWQLK